MSGRRQSLDYISRDALQPKGYSVSSISSGCSTSAWTTHPGRVRGGRGAHGGRGMPRGGAKRSGAGRGGGHLTRPGGGLDDATAGGWAARPSATVRCGAGPGAPASGGERPTRAFGADGNSAARPPTRFH